MPESPKNLDDIGAGSRVLVDAAIFIYHFTGASSECRRLLERCEQGELEGLASVLTLGEVAHRLMTIEAVVDGHISPGNAVKKLRAKPEIIRHLRRFQEQVEKIPHMGIAIVPMDLPTFLRAGELRRQAGLLTNDSLVAAVAIQQGVEVLASSDRDFERLSEVSLYRPSDLSPNSP